MLALDGNGFYIMKLMKLEKKLSLMSAIKEFS